MRKRKLLITIVVILVSIIVLGSVIFILRDPLLVLIGHQTPTLGMGSKMVSKVDGMEMLYIPAGEFIMGFKDFDPANNTYKFTQPELQQPQHTIYLDDYWIDKTEITNRMFTKFINSSQYITDAEKRGNGIVASDQKTYWRRVEGLSWKNPIDPNKNIVGLGSHPVTQVSWNDANAYCIWAGRRLPTDAEWEKAARGTDMRIYPWGNNEPTGELANFPDKKLADYLFSAPVGSYPKGTSPYGALDMAGNVWEWVYDWYGEEYYKISPMQNPTGPSTGEMHIIRGGSWDLNYGYAAVYRAVEFPNEGSASLGFRCAYSNNK
jgi:formylglycine-generating enzyme required for sulfatase activity